MRPVLATVIPVQRLALSLSLALGCAVLAWPRTARADEVRIKHLDGTGTTTIIDVPPSMPGVQNLIRTTPGPVPKPGEVLIAPTEVPTLSPAPTPRPRDD